MRDRRQFLDSKTTDLYWEFSGAIDFLSLVPWKGANLTNEVKVSWECDSNKIQLNLLTGFY